MTGDTPETSEDLTPAEHEKRKTADQGAEDIAYTINHSLDCTLTDFLNPPMGRCHRWLAARRSQAAGMTIASKADIATMNTARPAA